MDENGARRASTRAARVAIFEDAAGILRREYPRKISIAEVSRRISVSPRQIQRVFVERAGVGFRTYLTRLRMSNAACLFAGSELPVKEVAERVGYRDASQFTKAFKRTHGVSPTEWRASAKARGPEANSSRCTQPEQLDAGRHG